jgi:hypothetical protein
MMISGKGERMPTMVYLHFLEFGLVVIILD